MTGDCLIIPGSKERVMAYGHAERTLAAIRLLEAQTEELLRSLAQLHPEQALCLQQATDATPQARDVRTGPPSESKQPSESDSMRQPWL
jgi:hypothetical protein